MANSETFPGETLTADLPAPPNMEDSAGLPQILLRHLRQIIFNIFLKIYKGNELFRSIQFRERRKWNSNVKGLFSCSRHHIPTCPIPTTQEFPSVTQRA